MTIFELLENRHTKLLSQNQCRRQNAHNAVGLSTRVSYFVGSTVDSLDLKSNSKNCTALLSSSKRIPYSTSQQPIFALCHPVTLPHSSQFSHFATPLHYLTAANSRTLPPRKLPHSSQFSHFATSLHYLTAANSRTLPLRYITSQQPILALCHSVTLPHSSQFSHFATP